VKTEDCIGRHLYKYQIHEALLGAFLSDYLTFTPGDVVLKRCPVLLLEYSPEYMRFGGVEPSDLVALLTGCGFRPYAVNEGGMLPVDSDVLCEAQETRDYLWVAQ